MPEPRDFRILQSLQAALQAISADDGYFHTVQSVAVKLDPNADVEDLIGQSAVRPFALLEIAHQPFTYQPSFRVSYDIDVKVHFVTDSDVTNDDSFLKTITRLWADVETAVTQDVTRGGDATDTRIGAPDFRSFDGGLAWAIVPLVIRVNRSYGAPTA